MHPVPTVLHRGGEIHPMHLYGTNVVWIKSNKANGDYKELIACDSTNHCLPEHNPSGRPTKHFFQFLELRPIIVICRGSAE